MATRRGGGGRQILVKACLALVGAVSVPTACGVDAPTFDSDTGGKPGGGAGANDGDAGEPLLTRAGSGVGGTKNVAGTSTGGAATAGRGGSDVGLGGAADGGFAGADGGFAGSLAGSPAAGESNAGGAGPDTTPSVCDGNTRLLSLADGYIDNFETVARFGQWYSFSDTTPPNMPPIVRQASGALATGWAGYGTAEDILQVGNKGYGAGIGFQLVNPAAGETCVDVSAFDGISLWAKGASGTANLLKFQVTVPASQPRDAVPPGDCVPQTACAYEHPTKTLLLTNGWAHHVIRFADLTSPTVVFSGKFLAFNIITPDTSWNVSIDEVTFYKGTAPTTPITPPQ
jgi:hypothetical protein